MTQPISLDTIVGDQDQSQKLGERQMQLQHQSFGAIIILIASISAISAQDQLKDQAKITVEMKPFTLTLVNEHMKPVVNAKVTAYGLRCEELPGSWISWPKSMAGKNEYVTDDAGRIEMQYPVKLGLPGQWMTINKIDFHYRHPEYVAGNVELDPNAAAGEHRLIQGCRTLFTCVDEGGVTLKEFGVLLGGIGQSASWKLDNGELRSSGVPDGQWQTMLIAPGKDGRHRFSGVLPARYAKDKDVTIRGVKLKPGLRLTGRLSDNVPRPIKEGRVMAWCIPKPVEGRPGDTSASVAWSDEVIIEPNGTFEFPSLPLGGTIQLIAICDGWLIEGVEQGSTVGMQIKLDEAKLEENQTKEVTLAMQQAGEVEVELLTSDGKPLVGATVSAWPGQRLLLSGSTTLGDFYRSMTTIEHQIRGKEIKIQEWQPTTRYTQQTNAVGKAVIRNIPTDSPQFLVVSHDHFMPKLDNPDAQNPFNRAVTFQCKSEELTKLTVNMVPIEEDQNALSAPDKDQ